jgi:uncharacterized protein YndB with AHSA1/START domain
MSDRNSKMPESVKRAIYNTWLKTNNKTRTAEQHAVSARTVGRIVAEFSQSEPKRVSASPAVEESSAPEALVVEDDFEEEDDEEDSDDDIVDPNDYRYFVVGDATLLNITRVRIDGSEAPASQIVRVGAPKFDEAAALAKEGKLHEAFLFLDEAYVMKKLTYGLFTLDTERGQLVYDDGVTHHYMPATLAQRAVELVRSGKEPDRLIRFSERLLNNPSPRAVKELYDFLVASDIEIDEDGMVLCYKRIKDNYRDCYTGKIDNRIGKTVEMKRFNVDSDSNVTCSAGLHVCSKAYLASYSGQRVVLCAVDPADFVSIPKVYYSIDGQGQVKAKARVCKYKVVREIFRDEPGITGAAFEEGPNSRVDDAPDSDFSNEIE